MPLPDERPRASVANLIGRFEQQVKRQPTTPPRSLSAVSNNTGDATKIEAAQRREWPPQAKSPLSSFRGLPSMQSPEVKPVSIMSSPPAEFALPQKTELEPESKAVGEPALPPEAAAVSEEIEETEPATVPDVAMTLPPAAPKESKAPTVKKAASTSPAKASPTARAPSKVQPSKSTGAPVAPKTTLSKTAMKTSSTLSQSTSTPVRASPPTPASHARGSSARPSPSSTLSPRSKTPSASTARAKTPSTLAPRAKTPVAAASSRAKTPSAIPPLPRSSGLYAPTAASLAKARGEAPVPATPSKRVSTAAATSERLSKPTASSVAKARTPALETPSPSRGAKPGVRGTRPSARGGLKARVPSGGAKVAAEDATTASASVVSSAEEEHTHQGEDVHQAPTAEAEVVEPVHEDGVRAAVAEAAQKAEEAEEAYEAKVETEAHEKTEGVPEATEVHAGATEAVEVHEVVIKPPISPPPESEPEERQGPQPKSVDRATDQGHAADADVVSGGVPSKEEIVVPVEGLPASSSDDIVNLVSMLEARPEKVSEPIVANGVKHLDDVAGEIPDEL